EISGGGRRGGFVWHERAGANGRPDVEDVLGVFFEHNVNASSQGVAAYGLDEMEAQEMDDEAVATTFLTTGESESVITEPGAGGSRRRASSVPASLTTGIDTRNGTIEDISTVAVAVASGSRSTSSIAALQLDGQDASNQLGNDIRSHFAFSQRAATRSPRSSSSSTFVQPAASRRSMLVSARQRSLRGSATPATNSMIPAVAATPST
ncbi:unnamed protein product, partial [Amoebophrya sp. A25]